MARPRKLRSFRLGIVLLVFGALAITGLSPARRAYEQKQAIAREEQRLAEVTEQNEVLQDRLNRMQDPAFAEKVVREELGLARPGDTVFVMPQPPEQPRPQEPAAEESSGPLQWIKDRLGLD